MNEMKEKGKELYIRYGSASSEAMFDFPCNFFQLPGYTGIIAYRIEHQCAIVFGEPICPPHETASLAEAFHKFCKEALQNVIYIIAPEKFAKWASENLCKISMAVCDEFLFDLSVDPLTLSHRLKHRVEKALKHGLTVHEYIPKNPEIESALKDIAIRWQRAIRGPHIYLGHLNFFDSYDGKRWFYVKDGEMITSMLMLSRVEASNGWLLKFLTTLPGAFHETSELLVTSVLETLRKEDCQYLTKGTLPSDQLEDIYGLSGLTTRAVEWGYKAISKIFKFKERKEYWLRYNPKVVPAYLLITEPRIGLNELRALVKVFKTSYTFEGK